jgi:biopolymer transport protein ExbD
MNPNTINNPRRSTSFTLSLVFLFALVLTPPPMSHAQELQKGITVQMPRTTSAIAYPAADNADAWVVAVTEDGKLYFGTKLVTPDQLAEEIKLAPGHSDEKLYIKADAHAPFAYVKSALGSARSTHFDEVVLLTSQQASSGHGDIVPPQGFEVLLGVPRSGEVIFVRLSNSAQASMLNVNDKRVPWSELESTLKGLVHSRAQIVQVETNDAVPFADVIRAIDEARAAGATVAVPIFHSL